MPDQTIRGEVFYRALTLDREHVDDDARTVPASLSSEIEVQRFFGKEVLVHTPEAVNLERATDGLPMLFGHDQDQPIGLVDDVRVEDGRLRGTLRFSKNRRATEVWDDVREGFLRNISIGYRIQKWEEEDGSDIVRAVKWAPFEASVVSVPADHTVGINRSKEELTMADETKKEGAPPEAATRGAGDSPVNVTELKHVREQAKLEGYEQARREHVQRVTEINGIFGPFLRKGAEYVTLRDQCIASAATVPQSRQALMDLLAGEPAEPIAHDLIQAEGSANGRFEQARTVEGPQGRRQERITGGEDAGEKFVRGVTQCFLIRAGLVKDEKEVAEARKSEFLGSSVSDLCRQYLVLRGVSVAGMNRSQIVGAALTTRGIISHSVSDFANIVEDAALKSLGIGYNEAPESWMTWCKTMSIPDFKVMNVPNISAFGDLELVYEDGEYKYGTFSDKKETLQLLTYGKLFSISRQALVNDDLNAFTRIPNAMGRAAARQVGDLAWGVLTTNAAMNEDATALFHANHSNFVAGGSGAAPSVATINTARTSMATQTDPSGAAVLNIVPRYLLVPRALEGTGLQIQMAEKDPAIASGEAPNYLRGTFETIADARLDADDAAKWYMAADPNIIDTVAVGFLDGQQTPFLETQNGWSVDGVAFKVRIDAAAAPLDYRGLYHNDGN